MFLLFSILDLVMDETHDIILINGKAKLNRLAYEGQLWKWRKKWVYLLNDGSLFYYDNPPNPSLRVSAGSMLPSDLEKPRGVIPIGECNVSKENGTKNCIDF